MSGYICDTQPESITIPVSWIVNLVRPAVGNFIRGKKIARENL